MNAYEIADELDGRLDHKAANMLRQQADRIKDLEKLLEHSVGADCREMRYIQEIENRDARIAELEKDLAKYDELAIDDLEGKRIIWCACGDGITPDSGAVCGNCLASKTITPQIKELSDEEILQQAEWMFGTHFFEMIDDQYWIEFAKAILKKASEK